MSIQNQPVDIKQLAASFATVAEKPQEKPLTPAMQLLKEAKPSIQKAIENGWSYRAIANWFTEKGFKVDERSVAVFCMDELGVKKTRKHKKVTKKSV